MLKTLGVRLGIVQDLFAFLWRERLWWMIPFVVTLVIIGVILIFAQSSPVVPFIYTAF